METKINVYELLNILEDASLYWYNVKNYQIDDLTDEKQKRVYVVASEMEDKYNAKMIELKELIKKNMGN